MKDFYSSFINPGDICFDVGANVGNRTEIFLQIGAKVVAIEPQLNCYNILKLKFEDKIEIVNKGIGSSEDIKEFYIANVDTISSFSKEWIDVVKKDRFKGYSWDSAIQVEMTTLDNLIKKYGIPKFIKIDVEGYELEVLKGLSHIIDIISFEYTVPERVDVISDCINEIRGQNIICNYSVGESMNFNSSWLSSEEMKEFIKTPEFIQTSFGDIYVKTVGNK